MRLASVGLCGLVVAGWGLGPSVGIWFVVLTVILMLLAWPTDHKLRLLVERAEAAWREMAGT